jgi:hypothetical protein
MKSFPVVLASAALLLGGAAVGPSFANGAENLFWGLETDFGDNIKTVCVAENYNNYPVDAVFEISPSRYDRFGNLLQTTTRVTLTPYTESLVFTWGPGYPGPGPECALLHVSVSAHPPRGHLPPAAY